MNLSATLVNKYGNVFSGMMAQTLPKPDAKIGDEATVLNGRDRSPAKIAEIIRGKNGKIKAYMLQEYYWIMDMETEGYAKEIKWDEPKGAPKYCKVITHGKFKGTVKDALIGHADPFYDRSF